MMSVPGSIVPSGDEISPPIMSAFVKTESVRVLPSIEPVVMTEQGLSLDAGWQKIEGVGEVR
jgi:hypothetical protein